MERLAPDCHDQLEQAAIRSWGDVKAGDAILWDRWVFHRTVSTAATTSSSSTAAPVPPPLRRYSIRYIPSNAKAFGAIHASIPQEGFFVGSPYYPQVWPHLIHDEMEALRLGLLEVSDMTLLNLWRNVARFLYQQAKDAVYFRLVTTKQKSKGQ
jgi:hypothetical protein